MLNCCKSSACIPQKQKSSKTHTMVWYAWHPVPMYSINIVYCKYGLRIVYCKYGRVVARKFGNHNASGESFGVYLDFRFIMAPSRSSAKAGNRGKWAAAKSGQPRIAGDRGKRATAKGRAFVDDWFSLKTAIRISGISGKVAWYMLAPFGIC